MKTDPNQDNDPLHNAMQAWKVATPLPPRFQEQVWQRIEQAQVVEKATLWMVLQNWFQTALSRRAVAVSYLVILLMVGLTSGYWQGRQKASRVEATLSVRYVQSVDPYQMPRR
ncbi:MAG: hypothetical protein JWR19_3941 [Pedosphaera sp.]|nr:hypothetical protein [Pedosphaera sp.]